MGVERKNHDRDSVQAKGSGYAKPTAELGPEMKTAAQVSKAVLHLAGELVRYSSDKLSNQPKCPSCSLQVLPLKQSK